MTISENNKIINSLQFYYGTPKDNYERFENSYRPNTLLTKIISIPVVVIADIIKIIFHIARAIFQGMFQVVRGNKLPLQADIYHVVRDLQSTLGAIVMIFNDKLGVYLIKNSVFQKSCYDSVIKDDVAFFEYMSGDQIKKLNLKDVTEKQLKNMFDLSGTDSKIKNKFANFSVEQVQSILLKLDEQGLSCISDEQLKGLDLKSLSKEKLSDLFPWNWIGCDEMKKRFANLSFEQVQSILLKLDKDGLSYISDEQLKGLDLKDLSKEKLSELFPLDCSWSQEIRNRFANLSFKQVQSILLKLDKVRLAYISDEQLKGLDLKNLSEKELAELFPYHWSNEIKNRFANLSFEQVQSILLKLDKDGLSYISDEQLKRLDLTDLSKENVGILFPTLSKEGIREESKSRVLSENEVRYETERRTERNTRLLALLTDTQFNQIKDKLEEAILNLRK